jgi:hypothetical protein
LVDALGSGSSRGFPVGVQISPSAPTINKSALLRQGFFYFSGQATIIPYSRFPRQAQDLFPVFCFNK